MDPEINKQLAERFAKLPKVVQDAITSADVEKHLRELAEHHKLHLDQWELLENEVMLSLLGFQPTAELASNITKHVGVDEATATNLAGDISTIVFEPIRQELERGLDYPDAVAAAKTGVETMRDNVLREEGNAAAATPVAAPVPAPVPAMEMPLAPTSASTPAVPVMSDTPTPVVPATPAPTANAPVAAILAATPPAPAPTATVERTEAHPNYTPGAASHERKAIAGDPYREQLA